MFNNKIYFRKALYRKEIPIHLDLLYLMIVKINSSIR